MSAQPPPLLPVHPHCVATHISNSIIKFADDTTVVGLSTNNDATASREVVRAIVEKCQENNLSLNKTKKQNVDFRRQQREYAPIHRAIVERVKSFKFLGMHITDDVKWSFHRQCGEESATAPLQP